MKSESEIIEYLKRKEGVIKAIDPSGTKRNSNSEIAIKIMERKTSQNKLPVSLTREMLCCDPED